MKRIHVFSGLALAAIAALSGCQAEIGIEQISGKEFTITASSESGTRTKNSGMSTIWVDKDALSVFYTAAGGAEYTSAGKFTISDGLGTTSGAFTAAKAPELSSGSYDWYALYPYGSGIKTPASQKDGEGYTYVGDRNGLEQEGFDNANVLCGSACPMYGVAKNVAAGDIPSFIMKQLATVIEFNVVNKTGAPLKVARLTLDESESGTPIVGSFYIDFTGEKPSYVPSDAAHVSSKAFVSVKGENELAADATAKIYLPFAPYVHDSSKGFVVVVEGEFGGQAFSKTVTLNPSAEKCVFEAGRIRKVTVVVDEVSASEERTVTEAIAVEDNTGLVVGNAIVAALTSKGYVITDGNNNVYVFTNSAPEVALGDMVRVSATKTTYYSLPELINPVATVLSSCNEIPRTSLTDITSTIDEYSSVRADYLTVTGPMSKSGSVFVVTPEGSTVNKASVNNPHASLNVGSFEGKTVKITGYYNTFHSANKYVQIIVTEIEEVEGPGPGPEPEGNTVSVEMGDYVTANDCTVSAGSDIVCYTTLDLSPAVRMSTSGSKNCGSFWKPKSTVEWRLYQSKAGDVTITVADGCELKLIQFTFNTDSNGILQDVTGTTIVSGEGIECSGKSATFTVGNSTEKTNGQVKITAVKVVYTGEGTLPPVEPKPDPDPEAELKLNGKTSETLYFDAAQAARQIVTVTCDNEDWTVTGTPDWVIADTNTEPGKIIIAVEDNEGGQRSVDLSVNHSNGELKRTLTVVQSGKPSGDSGANTATLTNADIVASGNGADGYKEWTITDSAGNEYNAYAIKKAHSKATSTNHYLQIKKYKDDVASYIQLPALGSKIVSITMTVSNANSPMSGGGNSATLFFSASDSTAEAGEGVASGVGASSVTIDASSLNLNTGYITASAAVRIWDIVITYD